MNRRLGPAFWVETVLASVAGTVAALTVVWPDWVEGVTGFSPDRHDGWFELQLVLSCALVAVIFTVLAHRRRCRAVTG